VKSLVFQARSGLIERKQARETPCQEIREQLATLRGGSLRRGPLRRHLKACPGCSEFRDEVRRQRQMVAALLPVVPTLGLRDTALASVGITASSAGAGGLAGGGAVLAAKAGIAKVAVVAVATTGAAGGAVAIQQTAGGDDSDRGAQQSGAGAAATDRPGMNAAKANGEEGATGSDGVRKGRGEEKAGQGQAGENGFEPMRGEPNGDRARDFARDRGQGNHHGLDKQIARGGVNPNRGPKPRTNPPAAKPQRPAPQRAAEPPKPEPGLGQLLAPVTPTLVPPDERRSASEEKRSAKEERTAEPQL